MNEPEGRRGITRHDKLSRCIGHRSRVLGFVPEFVDTSPFHGTAVRVDNPASDHSPVAERKHHAADSSPGGYFHRLHKWPFTHRGGRRITRYRLGDRKSPFSDRKHQRKRSVFSSADGDFLPGSPFSLGFAAGFVRATNRDIPKSGT